MLSSPSLFKEYLKYVSYFSRLTLWEMVCKY